MVTGKPEPFQAFAPTPSQPVAFSPPSKRDLTSWWRQFKRNTRKEDAKDVPRGIFGIPLNVSIKYANVAISLTNDNGESFIYGYVPIVVAKCGVFLKEKATDVEGIFRLNGSAKRIKDLQEIFDSPERYGKGLDWTGYTVHDAANVLRRYLNQLPEPIVPLDFYEQFRQPLRTYQRQVQGLAPSNEAEIFDHAKAVAAYQQLIRELPPLNKQLLLYILDLLAVFASKSEQNRMTSANLSAIFQPGLLSHPQHDMSPDEYKLSQDVLIFLIENQDHFLFGMNGTAADEETVKAVESGGLAPRAPTTTQTSIRRSVSSASGGADSFRKYGSLRRNVSVSSKNSRNSNATASPSTPSSLSGVHRSNTLPSKMAPPMQRRAVQEPTTGNATAPAPSAKPSPSPSRTPPSTESNNHIRIQAPSGPDGSAVIGTSGMAYVHSATHGPIPKRFAGHVTVPEPQPPREASVSPPPPTVVTPTKERKLSNFFSKSPPPSGEQRQPNRLRKKRSPGSVCESAQSSSQSLQGVTADNIPRTVPSENGVAANGAQDESQPNNQENGTSQSENGQTQTTDTSLKPRSRTPSMRSRSSFTDQSDLEQLDETARVDRKEYRQSWRFPRSSKRSSEQIGLVSPPLGATNPNATRSASSIGSWHQASRSSPSDLQQFVNDPANQPLSLDAELNNNGSPKEIEPERRSLFGKFKAKVGLSRDGKDTDSLRDRTRSPVNSDTENSVSNLALSPPPSKVQSNGSKSAPAEANGPDESTQTPVSPLPGSGMPPAIPEEPGSPESPVAPAFVEQNKEAVTSAPEPVPAQTEPATEPPKALN
ncbi:putative Rho GTPase activator (Sac7) [Aspergillus chevalieri]|uniref:Rho-GAP domain-containing protein n=1 Tax=Aspergillus chevalieri TaxID=182096 RepID=A0A7R7VNZ5_ASPCH|nr:uncharacterized protein ACHE_40037A [Aspergillus chevalieri]BCR87473.1 hypothetical protein ACHE_40037A [Aspergillus chevalieri]